MAHEMRNELLGHPVDGVFGDFFSDFFVCFYIGRCCAVGLPYSKDTNRYTAS